MIKSLTSFRLFFAVLVFFSHLSFLKNNIKYSQVYEDYFAEGFLGVSFFFILSGFILAYSYQEKLLTRKVSFRKFFVARVARIYPMHLLTLLIALPLSYSTFFPNIVYNFFLIQSFVPDESVFFSFNAPSWSISDEMFFYLLFPVIIFLVNRKKVIIPAILIFGISLVIILNFFLYSENLKHFFIYIYPPVRFLDFLLGIFLFQLYVKLKPIYIRINKPTLFELSGIILFISFFIFHDRFRISYRYSVYYWLPMCLIILTFALSSCCNFGRGGRFSRILSSKYLVVGGEISFSFYLLHYLVIAYLQIIFSKFEISLHDEIKASLIFVISIVSSYFCYTMVEKPCNWKLKNALTND